MRNVFLLVHISDTDIVLKCMDNQSMDVKLMCQQNLDVLAEVGELDGFITAFSQNLQRCDYRVTSCFLLNRSNRDIANLLPFLQRTFSPSNLFDVQKEDVNLQEIGELQIPDALKEKEELWDIHAKLSALGTLNFTKNNANFIGALSLDINMGLFLTALNNNRLFHDCRQFLAHDFPRCVPLPNPIQTMMNEIIFQADTYACEILESYRVTAEREGRSINIERLRVPLFLTGDVYSLHIHYIVEALRRFDSKCKFIGSVPDLVFHGLVYAFDNNMLVNIDPPAPSPSPVSFAPPVA